MTSAAWASACMAIATVIPERPWPAGINRGTVGNWDFVVNAGTEPAMDGATELPGYGIALTNREFIQIIALDPNGGAIVGGGITEDQFIAEMEALAVKADMDMEANGG